MRGPYVNPGFIFDKHKTAHWHYCRIPAVIVFTYLTFICYPLHRCLCNYKFLCSMIRILYSHYLFRTNVYLSSHFLCVIFSTFHSTAKYCWRRSQGHRTFCYIFLYSSPYLWRHIVSLCYCMFYFDLSTRRCSRTACFDQLICRYHEQVKWRYSLCNLFDISQYNDCQST